MGKTLKVVILCWLALMVALVYFDVFYFDGVARIRPWYGDMVLHLLGGGFIALSFIYLSGRELPGDSKRGLFSWFFLTLAAVLLVAIGWEFYEYLVNILTGFPQDPASDTVSDLVLGLVGGALVFLSVRRK